MRVNIKSNIKEVTKGMSSMQKKQIPFATAMAINATLGIGKGNTGKKLDKVLGQQMDQKLNNPTPATKKAFYRLRATKTNLTGVLGFKDWAAKYMQYQIEGGTRSSGKKFAIPTSNAKLNKYGNIPNKRAGVVKKKNQKIMTIKGMTGVYEVHKDRTLKLIVAFKNSATYRAKFPFYKIAEGYVNNNFPKNFIKEMNKALKTAK